MRVVPRYFPFLSPYHPLRTFEADEDASSDPRQRRIGNANKKNVRQALSSLSIFSFTRRLGMDIDDVTALVERACVEATDPALKAYFPLLVSHPRWCRSLQVLISVCKICMHWEKAGGLGADGNQFAGLDRPVECWLIVNISPACHGVHFACSNRQRMTCCIEETLSWAAPRCILENVMRICLHSELVSSQ